MVGISLAGGGRKKSYRECDTPPTVSSPRNPFRPRIDSDRRNLQGVPEGIVPPAFVGARDASREVTRYSMPTDQFGGKRSNLSRLENPIDI